MPTTEPELRELLQTCNLSKLDRLSGVPVRTLRRIKNSTAPIRESTVTAIAPHVYDCVMGSDELAERSARAAETRGLRGNKS